MAQILQYQTIQTGSKGAENLVGCFVNQYFSFQISLRNAKLVCQEEKIHCKVPIFLRAKAAIPDSLQACKSLLKSVFCVFTPKLGLELFLKGQGGGCCPYRTPISDVDSAFHNYGLDKSRCKVNNQQEAALISSEIRAIANIGVVHGMRLAALEDFPQLSIRAPYVISANLTEALRETAIWSLPLNFLVRGFIARLARKHMMDNLFLNGVFFTANQEAMLNTVTEILSMAEVKDSLWMESGVIAEFAVMKMLVLSATNTTQWWESLFAAAQTLLCAYLCKDPISLIPLVSDIFSEIEVLTDTRRVIKLMLYIDNLYFCAQDSNMDEVVTRVTDLLAAKMHRQWEGLYLVLAFIEWCIHRQKLNDIRFGRLKPGLEALQGANTGLFGSNGYRIRAKVANIYVEASDPSRAEFSDKQYFRDQIEAMKRGEANSQVLDMLKLTPEDLYLEPDREVPSSHFPGKEELAK